MENGESPNRKLHRHKLMLWIFMGSITMMFAALTSAFLVKKAHGNWMSFQIPEPFLYSTIIIIITSITLIFALSAAKKANKEAYLTLMTATIVGGISFLIFQFLGYHALINNNIFLSDPLTAAGSFLYVISLAHAAHLIGGIAFLIIMLFKGILSDKIFKDPLGVELTANYWHFVGILWVYLYVFFSINY